MVGWLRTHCRRARSILLISPTRSSWSLDRLRSTRQDGCSRSATEGTWSSSHSRTTWLASWPAMRAVMMPASMLSPPSLVATWCALRIAVASIRVVVDLPLVPVMSATGRPNPRFFMIWGSIFSATSPPIMPPEPRPVAREAKVASRASPMAALVRARKRGNFMRKESSPKLSPGNSPTALFRGWRVDRPVIERSTGEVSGGGVGSPGVIVWW